MEDKTNAGEPSNDNQSQDQPPQVSDNPEFKSPDTIYFSWSALEFIEHHKNIGWYMRLGLVIIVLSAAVYLIVKSIFPVVMFIIIGIVFGVIAGRKPKTIYYEINNLGIMLGKRFTNFSEFKSFNVIDESNIGSIVFNPFKRFMLPTTIYYELSDEEKIVNAISQFLPIVEPANDPVDQLMRKIRF